MSDVWLTVVVVGVTTMLFKAAGPVVLGKRALPPRMRGVVDLLAPVMLTALVVSQTFASGEAIAVDARVPGVLVGGVAVLRGLPLVPAMALGAAVSATLRLLS
jgi:branched chain amino acid efflux pump